MSNFICPTLSARGALTSAPAVQLGAVLGHILGRSAPTVTTAAVRLFSLLGYFGALIKRKIIYREKREKKGVSIYKGVRNGLVSALCALAVGALS